MNSLGPLVASSFGNSVSLILPCQLTIYDDINQLLSPILSFTQKFVSMLIEKLFFAAKRLAKASPSRQTGMKLHSRSQESGRRLFCCSGWYPYLLFICMYYLQCYELIVCFISLACFHHSLGSLHFLAIDWKYAVNLGDLATLPFGDVISA